MLKASKISVRYPYARNAVILTKLYLFTNDIPLHGKC